MAMSRLLPSPGRCDERHFFVFNKTRPSHVCDESDQIVDILQMWQWRSGFGLSLTEM